VDEEVVLDAAGIWKSGSDLITLWKTPHPSGISTIIQENANIRGEDFFSERIIVWFRLGSGLGGRSNLDRRQRREGGLTIVEPLIDGADEKVADQADQEEAGHQVHRQVVCLGPRDAVLDPVG
jgi:hypothetical protein